MRKVTSQDMVLRWVGFRPVTLFLSKIRSVLLRLYLFIFATPSMQGFNDIILSAALRARGYKNCCDFIKTGEAHFIRRLAEFSPKYCIDVGANRGQYSEFLLRHTDANVLAFEPLGKAFSSLEQLRERFSSRFVAFNYGIGLKTEMLEIRFSSEDSETASFSREVNFSPALKVANAYSRQVMVYSLDDYFESQSKFDLDSLDLIKIDTEGFEYEVLSGAQRTIERLRPKFIQIEFNWHQLFRRHTLLSIHELLRGYCVYQLLPYDGGMVFRDPNLPESNFYCYANFIFVRDDLRAEVDRIFS